MTYINTNKTEMKSSDFIRFGLLCFAVLSLSFIFSFTNAHSAQVTLGWDRNMESDLAGYKLYYGTSSSNLEIVNDVGNVTTHTVSNLIKGATYFFTATAYDTNLNESEFSKQVTYFVPTDADTPFTDPQTTLLNLTLSIDSASKSALPSDVIVTVKDQDGNPMPDVIVTATTSGRGAIIFSDSEKTDVNGNAHFRFRFKFLSRNGQITFSAGSSEATLTQLASLRQQGLR